MRRTTLRALSLAIGYLIALWVSQHDSSWIGYGPSDQGTGGDPLALMVFASVSIILWRVSSALTKKGNN